MRERHQPTDQRAQTAQDFAVGIGVFLVALTVVFGFVPQIMQPYQAGATADESSMTNRAATTVLSNTVAEGAKNDLNATAVAEYFDHNLSSASIHANLTLPTSKSIHVHVEQLDGGGPVSVRDAADDYVTLRAGNTYRNQSAVTVTRIVTMDNSPFCNVGCRLVVRVW